MCVCVCVNVCVCGLLAGGGVLTGQSRAFLLGGDVMRTSSPLADRQPCLCSPPEEKPHCVSECVCVCKRVCVCECKHVCVCACACISVWLRYWLMGEVGEAERHSRGSTFPCRSGRGNHLLMPSSETYTQKEEVSHVFQSTVAARPDCAAVSDFPLLLNSLLREAEFFAV